MTGATLTPAVAAMLLFGAFFLLMVLRVPVAFALGLACAARPLHRATAVADGRVQHDVQGVQLVHSARGPVLPVDGQFDECRRHHRSTGDAVANDGRQLSGSARADQRAAIGVLRGHFRIFDGRCREPGQDLHRSAGEGRLRPQLLDCDHGRIGSAGGDHSAVDPDGRLGRRAAGVDRRALPRRRDSGVADRAGADGRRFTSTRRSATIRLTRAPRSRNSSRPPW